MKMILWNLFFLCWNVGFAVRNYHQHDLAFALIFGGLAVAHTYFGARATQFYLWQRRQERKL